MVSLIPRGGAPQDQKRLAAFPILDLSVAASLLLKRMLVSAIRRLIILRRNTCCTLP